MSSAPRPSHGECGIPRLLLIEDDHSFATSFRRETKDRFTVLAVDSAELALAQLEVECFDLVLLDLYLKLGWMNGFEFLAEHSAQGRRTPVMILSSEERADTVLAALARGACGYAPKALTFMEIGERIEQQLAKHRLNERVVALEQELTNERPYAFFPHSPRSMATKSDFEVASRSGSTVLIQGESGTGKSVFARAIHRGSARREGPFVVVNCAAIASALLPGELFGCVPGAFTGAVNRLGYAEAAHGGTLFIDEIGKLDLEAQGRLLQLVEERLVYRLGRTKPLRVDTRIIAASSEDLQQLVQEGRFLRELYSRLAVLRIRLPALREMPEVIPEMAHLFLRMEAFAFHRPTTGIASDAIAVLQCATWPGNARELRNSIISSLNYCDSVELNLSHLPAELRERHGSAGPFSYQEAVQAAADAVRRRYILDAMTRCGWNGAAAARELGITRSSLSETMIRLGIGSRRRAPGE